MSKFLDQFNPESPKYDEEAAKQAENAGATARYISTSSPHSFEGKVKSYAIKPSQNPKKKGVEIFILEVEVTDVTSGAVQEKGGADMPMQVGQIVTHMVTLPVGNEMQAARAFNEIGMICAAISGQPEAPFLDGKTAAKSIGSVLADSNCVGRKIIGAALSGKASGDKVYYNTRFLTA